MSDESVESEYEDLAGNPNVQYQGSEVVALEKMLEANNNDPAYVLGVLTAAMMRIRPEKHTVDPEKLRAIRQVDAMINDVLRLRRQWLERYPELMANVEARW